MGVSRILLADQDMEYGRAFARAVSNLHSEFEITIVNPEALCEARPDSGIAPDDYELVLLGGYPDEVVETVGKKMGNARRLVLLTDHIAEPLVSQSEKNEIPFWYLFKYTDITLIISDLDFLIGLLTGKKRLLKKSDAPELVGFYSISGGAGKTVISLSTARELARYREKKVLYLSFEELPSIELLIKNHSQNRNIGDYLYYLFEKKNDNLCSRLESFIFSDEFGVETFAPTGGRNDMSELTQEETVQFFKVISDSCRYDYVVLDLKSDLSEPTLFLMNLCGRIVLIENDDPISRFKSRKLATYLGGADSLQSGGRYIAVVNQTKGAGMAPEESGAQGQGQPDQIFLEKDENSFQFGWDHLSVGIEHAFGIGIKRIADRILL